MKAGRFFVTVGIIFSVLGCSVAKDQKNAENMEKEGNALIAAKNAEIDSLGKEEGIWISWLSDSKSSADSFEWNKKSPEKIADLRKRLEAVRDKTIRILEIGAHKHMILTNPSGVEQERDNAIHYLNSLNKSEGKEVQEVVPAEESKPIDMSKEKKRVGG